MIEKIKFRIAYRFWYWWHRGNNYGCIVSEKPEWLKALLHEDSLFDSLYDYISSELRYTTLYRLSK